MSIIELKNISPKKKQIFTELIYSNFFYLTQFPKLKHTMEEIKDIFDDNDSFFIIYLDHKKILGYILGKKMTLNKRNVLFVTYIFTSPNHRKNGIGHLMMNYLEKYGNNIKYNGIMLTCDTDNNIVYDWYLKMGYMPDMEYRTYDRHDTLYKSLRF